MLRGLDNCENSDLDLDMGIRALYHVKPKKYRSGTDVASQIGAELRNVYPAAQVPQTMRELDGLPALLARLDAKVKNEGRD